MDDTFEIMQCQWSCMLVLYNRLGEYDRTKDAVEQDKLRPGIVGLVAELARTVCQLAGPDIVGREWLSPRPSSRVYRIERGAGEDKLVVGRLSHDRLHILTETPLGTITEARFEMSRQFLQDLEWLMQLVTPRQSQLRAV